MSVTPRAFVLEGSNLSTIYMHINNMESVPSILYVTAIFVHFL